MADQIVINSKTQRAVRVQFCREAAGARNASRRNMSRESFKKLIEAGVELRGDEKSRSLAAGLNIFSGSQKQDWYEEYLRLCMAVRVVANVDEAIAHINRYSTKTF